MKLPYGGRRNFRHNISPMKQDPRIPKFYGDSDPKVYLDCEAKVEQIFNVNHVEDQEQVAVVVVGFKDYVMTL